MRRSKAPEGCDHTCLHLRGARCTAGFIHVPALELSPITPTCAHSEPQGRPSWCAGETPDTRDSQRQGQGRPGQTVTVCHPPSLSLSVDPAVLGTLRVTASPARSRAPDQPSRPELGGTGEDFLLKSVSSFYLNPPWLRGWKKQGILELGTQRKSHYSLFCNWRAEAQGAEASGQHLRRTAGRPGMGPPSPGLWSSGAVLCAALSLLCGQKYRQNATRLRLRGLGSSKVGSSLSGRKTTFSGFSGNEFESLCPFLRFCKIQ